MSKDKRKYYKTTFLVTVLSEDNPVNPSDGLADIATLCDDGPCVGTVSNEEATELTPKQAAQALLEAGSEPGFFQLDEDGNKE